MEKGSVAIDGISLTVAAISDESFQVSVIPHTLQYTILGYKRAGDMVNLENDIIGKYIRKFSENKGQYFNIEGIFAQQWILERST